MEDKRKVRNEIYNTSIKIETKGKTGVVIDVKGSNIGIIYKMAYILSELQAMGCIEEEDFEAIVNLAKEYNEFKTERSPKIKNAVIAELSGELAQELYDLLNKCKKGEIDKDEIDIPDFIKRAQEQNKKKKRRF